ncbi:hypothetical protein Tco_0487682 [Tanacetum coccineum]
MSTGRVCIATKSHHLVSEKVKVEVHGEIDANDIDNDVISSDANSDNGLEDILKNLNEGKEDEESITGSPKANVDDSNNVKVVNTFDLSCPPGFEHLKKGNTRRCSTSFAKRRRKDIKGISFIHDLSRLIDVGNSLGIDVRGCRKSLSHMINEIGAHIVDK